MTCERCDKTPPYATMSRFNTDIICPDCERKEKAHPKYPEAEAAELAAVKAGNYNYPGIGLPADLR